MARAHLPLLGAALLVASMSGCHGPAERPVSPAAPPAPGSASAQASSPAAASSASPTVLLRFAQVARDRWRADYTFSAPVRAVAFSSGPYAARGAWRVVTDGGRIVRAESGDYVVAPGPVRALSIEIPESTKQPEKDYRDFYRFSDGGALAYTGHLAVRLATCGDGGACADSALAPGASLEGRITLVAAPGEAVVVQGQPRGAEATTAMIDEGTYAYLGARAPVETPDFVGVIDPGYPEWLRAPMDRLLPRLFALYADALGRPAEAAQKPVLFATFAKLEGERRDIGGNVLSPRTVNFGVGLGARYLESVDDRLRDDLMHLFAHEVAHLWNAEHRVPDGGPAAAWMHEGSADALAFRALRALGVLDEAGYRARLSSALSLCVLSLSEGLPLSASTRPGRSRDFYECGSTIALLTEATMKKRGGAKADLFTFWRAVFARASAASSYDEALYFKTLDELGGDPEVTAFVLRLVREPLADATGEIRQALARVGVETTVLKAPLPVEYEAQAARAAVRALLPAACVEGLAFGGNKAAAPRVKRDGVCGTAVVGDVMESMAGVDLAKRGASAFDAGAAQCLRSRTVEVGIAGKASIRVACAEVRRARPAYLVVTKGF